MESDDIATFMEAGTEEEMIAASLAANPEAAKDTPRINRSGVVEKEPGPPKRPDYFIAPKPLNALPAGQGVLWAARIRTEAEANALAGPDPALASSLRQAERMEAESTKPMAADQFEVGAGGELVPNGTVNQLPAPWRDTIRSPSLITAEASRSRLDLANDCGALSQTLDICETIGAGNSLEKMIASQMAVAHKVAMRAGQRAVEAYEREGGAIDKKFREACSVQGQRETNAMARASDTVLAGALALQKLRSGGKQNITVTHIQNTQVNDGGKAIVTSGTVAPPGADCEQGGVTIRK